VYVSLMYRLLKLLLSDMSRPETFGMTLVNGLLTQKLKGADKPKLVRAFPTAGATAVQIFSQIGHWSGLELFSCSQIAT